MRKITLFLSLCLAFVGITATAQTEEETVVTELSALQNGKAYWLQSGRDNANRYLVYNINNGQRYLKSNYGTGLTNWTKDDNDCWKFAIYKSTSGKYYIYNLAAGMFIGYSSDNNAPVPLVPYPTNDIKIEKISTVNGYPFVLSTDGNGLINLASVGSHGVVNWAAGKQHLNDGGNAMKFIEAGDLTEAVQNTIKTRVEAAEAGIALTPGTRYNVKVSGAYLSNRPDDNSINQLKAFTNAANSKAGKAVLQLEATNLNYVYKIKYQQNQLNEEYTYLVYSAATGDNESGVQVLTSDNQQFATNDKWYFSPTSDGNTFKISPYHEGAHWNLWGGSAPAKIGLWGNESQANNVVFEAADITAEQAATALTGYLTEYINSADFSKWTSNGQVGYAPASAVNTAKADAAKASSLYECIKILNESNYAVRPEAGKYYTIRNAKVEGEYLVENYDLLQDNNYSLFCTTLGNNTTPSLWKFEEMTEAGKTNLYHIKNVNSGLYMSKSAWDYAMRLLPAEGEIGEFNIFAKKWVDVDYALNIWDPTHDGTVKVENDGTIKTWKATNCENVFFIEEATEIPVSISAVGYATLNLPFAVEIAEGVTAHTAAEGDTEVTLTEISGTVIPANTPVILTGNEGNYKFTINYDNTDAALTTALSGTTVPETIAEGATAYILKNGSKGVGMYLVNSDTDRTIPANKAYLGSTQAAAEVKRFALGGEATGIEGITAGDKAADIYYDLNGRRVLYPAHGVFVKSNGQKVLVK